MTTNERAGLLTPAIALITWLFIDILRVWLPALLLGTDLLSVARGAVGLVIVGVGPALIALTPAAWRRDVWRMSLGVLLLTRLVLQFSPGGGLLVATSSIALVAATVALGIGAAMHPNVTSLRFSMVAGLAASGVAHAGLAMTDLVWRTGPAAWITTGILLLATAYSAWIFAESQADATPEAGRSLWWLVAISVALLQILVFVPGRVATATHWTDGSTAAVVVVAAATLVLSVIVGLRIGHAIAGPAGAGLVLVGTTGALEAATTVAVVAQLALASGLGLVIGACDRVGGQTTPRHRSVTVGAIPVLICAIAFVYYPGFGFALPFNRRIVLLAVGIVLAVGGLWAGAARERQALKEPGLPRKLLQGAVLTAALAVIAAFAVGDADRATTAPGPNEPPLRVVQVNLNHGHDAQGRFMVHEIADVLQEQDPDVVVLNAVNRGWMTTGGHDVLRLLSGQLGLVHVFGPAGDEVTGNAILSRLPIAETSVDRLPRGQDPIARSQLIAVLDVAPEEQLAILATELSDIDQQGATRLPQTRSIAATLTRLQERGIPVVVAGTFHAEPESPEMATLLEAAQPVFPSGTATWPSDAPSQQIDHVLTTDRIRVQDAEILPVQTTPHRPLLVELEVIPEGDDEP